jgi:tetratricopeptide (TPR) repeat protein
MAMWKRACVYLRCTELLRAFRTMADEATEEMLRKMRLTRTERAFHALFASATSRASSRAFHTMVHYCHQRAAATTSLRHAAAFLRGDGLARAWHSLLEVRSIALNENMRRMRGLAYVLRRQLALAFARWRFDFQGHFRVAMLRRIAGRLVHWRIHRALGMWNSLAKQKLLLRSAALRFINLAAALALSRWSEVVRDWDAARSSLRACIVRYLRTEQVRAFLAWVCHASRTAETARMLRAAVAMFTRRDMVGAVRAWQSACRAAATLTHALSALMDRDLLCAWRSWSEWHERRAAFLATTERFGGRWGHRQVAHAWNTWHGEWTARLVAHQRAISRMKNSKLARAWQTWLLLTRNLNPIRQAIGFMQNNQLARSWRRWMAMLAERKEATDRLSYAAKALLKRGLARALRSWQACLHQATRLRGIVTRWLQRSMLRGWIRWRQWYELRTETLGDLRRAVIRLHNDRKASALDSWRASIRERFQMRDMLALALVRWRHNEQWRAMDGWVDFVSTNLELVGLARLLGRKAGLRHGLNFLNFRSSSEWQLMRGLRGWKRSTLLRQLYDTQMEQLLSKHSVVRRWIYQKFLRRAWRTWCSHCTVEVEVQNVRLQQNAALADPPTASRPRAPFSLARAPSFVTNPSFVTKNAAVQQSLPQPQTGASAPARTAAAAGAIARARAQVGIPMEASTPPTVGIPKASAPPPQQQAVAEKVPAAKANAAAAKSKEGHALNEMADFAGARDAFDEAYRMCPRDGEFAKQSAICLFSAGNMALKANDILGAKARYDELLGLASLDGALRAKVLEKAAAVVEATAAAAKAAPASALRSAVPAPVRAPAGIPARAPVPAPAAATAPSPGGELSGSENTRLRGAVNELVTGMGIREDRRSRMVAGSAEAALEVAAGAFAKAGKGAAFTKTERALIDMGFDREKVVAAAAAADGDFQKAVNILFLEKASSTPRPSPNRGTQSSSA